MQEFCKLGIAPRNKTTEREKKKNHTLERLYCFDTPKHYYTIYSPDIVESRFVKTTMMNKSTKSKKSRRYTRQRLEAS